MIKKRHNSSIEFKVLDGRDVVIKKYHSSYTVGEEIIKLKKLNSLISFQKDIRIIDIVYTTKDSITMERLFHGDLRFISREKFEVLRVGFDSLIKVLNKLEDCAFHCDLDVSNILVDLNSEELVIIDPVHYDNDLPHFSAVVLFIGLFKSMLLSPRMAYAILVFQNKLINSYVSNDYIKRRELMVSLLSFLDKKIYWNKQVSSEKVIERPLRLILVIPLLHTLKILVRLRFSSLWP